MIFRVAYFQRNSRHPADSVQEPLAKLGWAEEESKQRVAKMIWKRG
jgi:hypothetical protein